MFHCDIYVSHYLSDGKQLPCLTVDLRVMCSHANSTTSFNKVMDRLFLTTGFDLELIHGFQQPFAAAQHMSDVGV